MLCALRWLGRGWTIDDLHENTLINPETIRLFIQQFIIWGSTTLYDKYVKCPVSTDELQDCEQEFDLAGLPGCVGSTDATHIIIERCPYKLRQLHMGYKLPFTARTYNLTVNHWRRILNTTSGHPARFNDKSLICYDHFVQTLKNGKYDDLHQFELYDYDENDEVVIQKYCGCYVIVDNGYLRWSVTVPPLKKTAFRTEIRFSDWVESMRKDVECTFGILKGRWRILKYGLRTHSLMDADNVWKTCCALHNMLLEVDGLASGWEHGVRSDYETELDESQDLPFALRRLIKPGEARNFDISGVGIGNDIANSTDSVTTSNSDHVTEMNTINLPVNEIRNDMYIPIKNMPFQLFRQKLIRHFNIAFQNKEVEWPRRLPEKYKPEEEDDEENNNTDD